MSQSSEGTAFAPPYLSFETFRSFIARLDPSALPPRIDRSMMVGMAGGTQTYLLQALRAFELLDEANRVQPTLLTLVGEDEDFARGMAELLERFYPEQSELSRMQGTAAQLAETFQSSGYTGSTLRKAVTFYLHAAKAAGIPMSTHFRAPSPRTPARAKSAAKKRATSSSRSEPTMPIAEASEMQTIQLRSGGRVSLSCTAAFLTMTREDREFVFGLVDALDEYQSRIAKDDAASGGQQVGGAEGP